MGEYSAEDLNFFHRQDLEEMLKADKQHLREALEAGDRVEAHRFVDALIDNQRELEDVI